jgi:histidyl-tRNA synthetase
VGKQFQFGSAKGHRLAVVVGPAEQESMTFNLRDLSTREERKGLSWDDLESIVASSLGLSKGGGS